MDRQTGHSTYHAITASHGKIILIQKYSNKLAIPDVNYTVSGK